MAKTRYEIRVRGRLGKALLTAVPDLEAVIEPPQTVTVLRGDLTDQAELHDILQTLAGLGIELIEVRRLTTGSAPSLPTGVDPSRVHVPASGSSDAP
ncbi:MAG: hypothetical protein ABWX74_00860 [Aeromicrobium sp.]